MTPIALPIAIIAIAVGIASGGFFGSCRFGYPILIILAVVEAAAIAAVAGCIPLLAREAAGIFAATYAFTSASFLVGYMTRKPVRR